MSGEMVRFPKLACGSPNSSFPSQEQETRKVVIFMPLPSYPVLHLKTFLQEIDEEQSLWLDCFIPKDETSCPHTDSLEEADQDLLS